MCKFCKVANRLGDETAAPRWFHHLNRALLAVSLIALVYIVLGK